jgi:tetratricopeptide (TPR) repeat protein
MSAIADVPQIIDFRYRLLDQLGSGGMGIVHRALDRLNNTHIALKRVYTLPTPQPEDSPKAENLETVLAQEFRMLASLRHPNIIPVYDFGFDHGQPYFTMELLTRAQTITQAAENRPFEEKIDLLVQLLRALWYLHRRVLLHRDLKPSNVLVDRGVVRILDFGLSMIDQQVGGAGTLHYMSPEALQKQPIGVASDLWSVGVIAYECFSGTLPFSGENPFALMYKILRAEPGWDRLDAPPELVRIIRRLLGKNPQDRYPSPLAVIDDLSAVIHRPLVSETEETRESFLQAARFIGRETELTTLRDAFQRAIDGSGSAWLIGGESGVGKSRLLDEVRIWTLIRGALVLHGQAVMGGGVPYQLWQNVLPRLILATHITELEASILKGIVPNIEALVGYSVEDPPALEAKQTQQRLLLTITDLFKRVERPIVLLLEDLHWSTESLDVVQELLKELGNGTAKHAWLIVGSFRSDEAPQLPDQLPFTHVMELDRFSETETARLSASILGEVGQRGEVVELLQTETEGNAFFVVEVVRALAEEVGSLGEIGQTTLRGGIITGGLLQITRRRLAQVPAWAQEGLWLAAVAGRFLDMDMLAATAQFERMDEWLLSCSEVAVLEVADGKWRFAHDKLRATLLADIPAEVRPTLHGRIARAMEQTYPDQRAYAEPLARHWEAAGDNRKAAHFYIEAVNHLLALATNYPQAEAMARRALELDTTPDSQHTLRTLLGDIAVRQNNFAQARTHYESLLDEVTAQTLDEASDSLRVTLLNNLSGVHRFLSEYDLSSDYANRAFALANTHSDRQGVADSLLNLGSTLIERGSSEQAKSTIEEALSICRALNYDKGIVTAYLQLGRVSRTLSNFDQAQAYLEQGYEISKRINDRFSAARFLGNLGSTASSKGDRVKAQAYYEQALAEYRQIGDRQGIASMLQMIGNIFHIHGDYAHAKAHYEDSLAIRRTIGDKNGMATLLNNLASIAFDAEDYVRALALFTESTTVFKEIGSKYGMAWNLNGLCATAMELAVETQNEPQDSAQTSAQTYAKARNYALEGVALMREVGDRNGEGWLTQNLGTVAFRQEDYATAEQYYLEALRIREAINEPWGKSEVLRLLGVLYMLLDKPTEAHKYLTDALALAKQIGQQDVHLSSLVDLCIFYARTHQMQSAFDSRRELMELACASDTDSKQRGALNGAAYIALAQGNAVQAAEWLGLAVKNPKRISNHPSGIVYKSLVAVLDPHTLAEAMERGRSHDVKRVIEGLCREGSDIQTATGGEHEAAS